MHLQSFPCSLFSYRKRLVHKKERFILCSVKAPSSCLPRQMLLVKYWTLNRKKKQLWAYFATSTAFLLVFDICNIVPWNLWQEVEKQAGFEKKAKRKNSPSYKTLTWKASALSAIISKFPLSPKKRNQRTSTVGSERSQGYVTELERVNLDELETSSHTNQRTQIFFKHSITFSSEGYQNSLLFPAFTLKATFLNGIEQTIKPGIYRQNNYEG